MISSIPKNSPAPIAMISGLAVIALLLLPGCAGNRPAEKPRSEAAAPSPSTSDMILDAKTLASNGQYEPAAELLEKVLAGDKENLEAARLLARIYAAMGKSEESARAWEKVFSLDPADPDAAYEIGSRLAKRKNWSELRSKMLSFIETGKPDSRHYLLLGETDLELGMKRDAEKYLKLASRLERAKFLLGKLYYENNRLDEAERMFKEVLAENPNNFSSNLHLGWLYYNKGNKALALKHYRAAVRLMPESSLARLSLAKLLEEMGRTTEAIENYEIALSQKGRAVEERKRAYINLCNLLVKKGRNEEALKYIAKGLEEFHSSGGLYYFWGVILMKEGEREAALTKLRKAAADPLWQNTANKLISRIMR